MQTLVGDKVRLKSPRYAKERGVVVSVDDRLILVQVNGAQIELDQDEVTNLSLAARKAWKSMPHRRVGRPKGSCLCDRVSVTLRIDRQLWAEFRRLEADGLIDDRTATINAWLREKTTKLKADGNADGKAD
jgi:hypothetical protein